MTAAVSRTALVAGATGYVGRHVCVALHRAGYRVRALVRDPTGLEGISEAISEVFVGSATNGQSLLGLCDDVDLVFSSIGLRSLKRKPTVWDVDYQANMNILESARAAGAKHFLFLSLIHARKMRDRVDVAEARERVVDAVKRSGMRWTVLRPTSFFRDLEGFFRLFRRTGRAWLVGTGDPRSNPIHGEDLAEVVVRAVDDPSFHNRERSVGGRDVFSMNEIVELAFEAVGRPGRIHLVPSWAVRGLGRVLRPINATAGGFLDVLAYEMTHDVLGEPHGRHRVRDFFLRLARQGCL